MPELKDDDDFVGLLKLDESSDLIKLWGRQARRFYAAAKDLAEARLEHDRAKAQFDVCEAELSLDVRSNPGGYGLVKVTEDLVEKTTEANLRKVYRGEWEHLCECKHRVEIFQARVNALNQFRDALEAYVKLHGQQYFAAPRAGDAVDREQVSELEKRAVRKPLRKGGD